MQRWKIIKCLEATPSAFGVSTVAENEFEVIRRSLFQRGWCAAVGHDRRRDRQDHGHGTMGCQHHTAVREGSATSEPFFGGYGVERSTTTSCNPLQLLKAEFAELAEQVAAQTSGATSTHGRLQREIDEGLEKLQKKCALVAEKRIISLCGAGRHRVHLAMVVAEGAVPMDWRKCGGLEYAFWAYIRHSGVPAFLAGHTVWEVFRSEAAEQWKPNTRDL